MNYLDEEKDFQLERLLNENEALREKIEEQKNFVKRLEEEVSRHINEKKEIKSMLDSLSEKREPVGVRSKVVSRTSKQLKGKNKSKVEKNCLRCSVKISSPEIGKKFCKKCSALLSKEGRDLLQSTSYQKVSFVTGGSPGGGKKK